MLGPLRGVAVTVPAVSFAGAMVLFLAPGALLAGWFAGERLRGAALVPAAFALGAGFYGLLAVPALILHLSLNTYVAVCGAVLVAFLAVAAVRALARKPKARGEPFAPAGPRERWLWLPFLVLGGFLAFVSRMEVPLVDGDTWNYLAWTREYLSTERLASVNPYFGDPAPAFSRIKINGWVLEQAALSRLSGIDPIPLLLHYLSPFLVVASLLAFYALARALTRSAGAALLAGCLYALFLLFHFEATSLTFGGEFLSRVVQDKGVARFVFLPMALVLAVAFLEDRRRRYLLTFGFLCWAVVTVHPVGLAIIGLSAAGLGLFHVATAPGSRSAWTGAAALGLALLSILLVPGAVVPATGESLSTVLYSAADIGEADPVVIANQVFVREEWQKIFVLGDGSYIMHPSLIFNPVIAAAYVLGVPFLVWRLLHRKGALAAQLLLGTLLVATVACYAPPVATFLGERVVAPGQLHRLSWPIPLAALLTLGWMAWEALRYAAERLRLRRGAAGLLSLALVLALSGAVLPRAAEGVKEVRDRGNPPTDVRFRFDPVFWWLQRNLDEPGVVLASDWDNLVIPAYSANANVVSFRGAPVLNNLRELERVAGEKIEVPRGALDVRRFYSGATDREAYSILRRHEVDYVLVVADDPVDRRMEGLRGLDRRRTPGERYAVYAVNLDERRDGA